MAKSMSFICQKGGTGKSTLTKLTAAYFNDRGVSCLVIDSDYPQHSIYSQRGKDLHELSESGLKLPTQEELIAKNVSPYPIYPSNMETSAIRLTALKTSNDVKLVLVDLPGTLNLEGIANVVRNLDLVIVPCELEPMSIKAAFDTLRLLRERRAELPVYMLWSRLDRSHSVAKRLEIEALIKATFPSVEFLSAIAFKSRDFRDLTTLSPAPESCGELMRAVLSVINKTAAAVNTVRANSASANSSPLPVAGSAVNDMPTGDGHQTELETEQADGQKEQ